MNEHSCEHCTYCIVAADQSWGCLFEKEIFFYFDEGIWWEYDAINGCAYWEEISDE
jgi:hypothetical protein